MLSIPLLNPWSPAAVFATPAIAPPSAVPSPLSVVQPATARASQVAVSPSILAPPSSYGSLEVTPTAPSSFTSQLPHAVPSRAPPVTKLDATTSSGASITRQLTAV